jgi:RHS repeat-associated protein
MAQALPAESCAICHPNHADPSYAYQFDAAGNRTQLVHYNGASTATTSYSHNAGNQLTESGPYEYSYDLNGNMEWIGDQVYYGHNRENRLVEVDNYGDLVTFVYDALGRRIGRTGPDGTKTRFYYDGLNVLLTREKPSGSSVWRTKQAFTLKPAAIGQIISERTNTAWNGSGTPTAWTDQWYHFDLLGNTTLITNSSGAAVSAIDMEAYGTVLSGGQNGYRLTTKGYDADAGLCWFGERWHSQCAGRWLEREPSGADGGNLYQFVFNNPLLLFDDDGLESKTGDPGVREASYFDCFARCLTEKRCPLSGGKVPGLPFLAGVPTPKHALYPYKFFYQQYGVSPYTNPARSLLSRCGASAGVQRVVGRGIAAPAFVVEAGWDIAAECYCASSCLNNPYNF